MIASHVTSSRMDGVALDGLPRESAALGHPVFQRARLEVEIQRLAVGAAWQHSRCWLRVLGRPRCCEHWHDSQSKECSGSETESILHGDNHMSAIVKKSLGHRNILSSPDHLRQFPDNPGALRPIGPCWAAKCQCLLSPGHTLRELVAECG